MTTLGPAREARRDAIFARVAKLLDRGIAFPIEDAEAFEEMESACTTAETLADPAEQQTLINAAISYSQTASFIRRFSALNDKFMPLGRWVSPTYLGNGQMSEIEKLLDELIASRAAGDAPGVSAMCNQIVHRLAAAAFDPTNRAFMNLRATRLPHLSDVAHYLETATLQFYRQEYFSVANTLIPAIERVLVSMSGWRLADGGEIGTRQYRDWLEAACTTSSDRGMKLRFDAHRKELVRFLFERFFKRSGTAAQDGTYDSSLINRAFSLHLNEPGSYYTFEDCVTYFQLFDLFTEFIASMYVLELPGLIPGNDPELQKRMTEYWSIILTNWLTGGESPERQLLYPTAYFVRESDHNYLSLHEGVDLNRLLYRVVPSLDSGLLVRKNLHPDRVAKLEWLINHLAGERGIGKEE